VRPIVRQFRIAIGHCRGYEEAADVLGDGFGRVLVRDG
jgi:hypothetical protein